MSALSKLMEARNQFHKRELKKTGWNDFSKFKYLELADFLIPAMEIFDGLKLAAVTSFTKELATMTITDLEDNSSLTITSPFGSAALKACHEVQNIGAVETYQRRYLWVAALEIVEHDALDATTGKKGDGEAVAADVNASIKTLKAATTIDALNKYWAVEVAKYPAKSDEYNELKSAASAHKKFIEAAAQREMAEAA